GGLSNRCEIDLSSGQASLLHGSIILGAPAATGIVRPGSYDLSFANVDGRLTLWVEGRLPFENGRICPPPPSPLVPTNADLEPARIAVQHAAASIESLVLKRDVYYTLAPSESDYDNLGDAAQFEPSALYGLLEDPDRFARLTRRPSRD